MIVATANLCFTKSRKDHRAYLSYLTQRCDVLAVQEAKRIRLRKFLPLGWRTMQRTGTAAKRGSAVSWRTGTRVGVTELHVGAKPRQGWRIAIMLTRWFAVAPIRMPKATGNVDVIAAHYPPQRYRWLWPTYDRAIAACVLRSLAAGHEVVLCADFNWLPRTVAVRLAALGVHLSAHGDGKIDGFLVSKGLKVTSLHVDKTGLRHRWTDHPTVIATIAAA